MGYSVPYSKLGAGFADVVEPADFPETTLRFRNDRAAREIGLEGLSDAAWVNHFARFQPLADNIARPLAMRYHGHQFRRYNPQLGDGRGFLFAQLQDKAGRWMDLGTKGSGTTPYSRGGDGRLTLKGGVREILASEMLEALGANTSRSFSLIETGEQLVRGDEPSPTRSSVLVRLCHGHIRIGSFQYHAFKRDTDRLEALLNHCLTYYFGETPTGSFAVRIVHFLELVSERLAHMAADLMATGFVHGVLNSDNINITGEIFDFGPWRMLPAMNLGFTAAYFDETGLYAFGRQAEAIHWNLHQLAACFIEELDEKDLREALAGFSAAFEAALRHRLIRRLGLHEEDHKMDTELLAMLNRYMLDQSPLYEQFFFDWYGGAAASASMAHEAYQNDEYKEFFQALAMRAPRRPDIRDHAYFRRAGPVTMLIEEVEELWGAIAERDDWAPFHAKLADIRCMAEALA